MRRPSRYVHPSRDRFNLFDATVQLRHEEVVPDLPASIQELVDVIGLDATIDLVKAFGGGEPVIPWVIDGTSPAWARLVESIGRAASAKLAERYKAPPTLCGEVRCSAAPVPRLIHH